jgi:DNA helicase II / ATP-dependent DNA helicase PcrA
MTFSPLVGPAEPYPVQEKSHYQLLQRFAEIKHLPPTALDTLNAYQQKAVEHRGTHLLILAGAGTGKTKTLTHRTAGLLRSFPAENIVVMSFTIKAAQELYERMYRLTGTSEISQLWLGTSHSICRRLLAENAALLDYKSRFGVLDTDDSREVLRRCVPQGKFLDVKQVYMMYSLSRNSLRPWKTLLEKFSLSGREDLVTETLRRYHFRMRRANKMDFDDLLTNTIVLLENNPQVRDRYQREFKQILVDEYQDTSPAQCRILELLAHEANVTVVGDDSQAIYGFRGATVENILNFENGFPGAAIVRLEQNYRCTPEILSVANQSISNNKRRKPKHLFTHAPAACKPTVADLKDRTVEATFVVTKVLSLLRAGTKLREIAVLFRSAFCVRDIEIALRTKGIPYALFGATPFLSQPHIKDLLAWFALVAEPQDSFSLGRVWRQQRGLTDAILGHIEARADENDEPIWQVAFEFATVDKPDARPALEDLQLKLSLCRDEYGKTKNLVLLLDNILDLHFRDYIRRSFSDAEARLEDFNVVREMVTRYSSLETFLDDVGKERLDVTHKMSAAGYEDGDFLSLASIHSAKGLEWHTVFLVGLVDGWLPDHRSFDAQGIEEERRIFHVAVTRAQQNLYLTHPCNSPDQHGMRQLVTSRFVTELPSELFDPAERMH